MGKISRITPLYFCVISRLILGKKSAKNLRNVTLNPPSYGRLATPVKDIFAVLCKIESILPFK